jgi:hypothetical protein
MAIQRNLRVLNRSAQQMVLASPSVSLGVSYGGSG